MFTLLLSALPTTIGVAQGVSAAKKEKQSQDSNDLLRKFTLRCRVSDTQPPSVRPDEVKAAKQTFEGGAVMLQHNQVHIDPATGPKKDGHPITAFLITYPDPTRPAPAPLGLVSSISVDPPVLNWIYVDARTREIRYGNRTQSREHVVGSWGRGGGWLELGGREVGERLGGEGGGVWVVGEGGGVRWGDGGESDVGGVRVKLERVFLEGPVEEKEKKEGNGKEGEGGRSQAKFSGGTTVVETGTGKE